MKALLTLVFLSSLASATSYQQLDRWSCYFPYRNGGLIRGAYVNVNFDIVTKKGDAVMSADCPSCHVMPRTVSLKRADFNNSLTYYNVQEKFRLNISWTNVTPTRGPYLATFGEKQGTCTPKN